MIIDGIETNLKPICETSAEFGDDVFHVKDGHIIPSLLMGAINFCERMFPVIQYLDADGEVYTVKRRPKDFKVRFVVADYEVMVAE